MSERITDVSDVKALGRSHGRDTVTLLTTGLSLGWAVYQSKDQTVTLVAPGDPSPKTIRFPAKSAGNRPGSNPRQIARTLMKFAEPHALAEFEASVRDRSLTDHQLIEHVGDQAMIQAAVANIREVQPIVDAMIETEEQIAKEELAARKAPVPKPPKPVTPHIITERPAMMHYSLNASGTGGKSYPSKTTIERRWSDGTTDYRCAVPDCGATSDNRLSFRAAHWAMHVRKGEADPIDPKEMRETAVDDPTYTEPAWTRTPAESDRVAELAAFIAKLDQDDPTILAAAILDHLFPDRESGPREPAAPLTPEQIIERIRRMVDGGHYADQEAIIQKQAEDLDEARALLATRVEASRLDEALARATRAEGNLRVLHEMIGEAVKADAE